MSVRQPTLSDYSWLQRGEMNRGREKKREAEIDGGEQRSPVPPFPSPTLPSFLPPPPRQSWGCELG